MANIIEKIKKMFKKEKKHFCKYCGRRLRSKKSIINGAGDNCLKRHKEEEFEKNYPPIIKPLMANEANEVFNSIK